MMKIMFLHFHLLLHPQICNIMIVPNQNSCNYFVYFCLIRSSSSFNCTCVELKIKDVFCSVLFCFVFLRSYLCRNTENRACKLYKGRR